MKITGGQALLMIGSLLISVGSLIPSTYHQSMQSRDIVTVVLLWCFSGLAMKYHDELFRRERILTVVTPALLIGFIYLLLSLDYLLSFGVNELNLYSILLGWVSFNSGLYYDAKNALRDRSRR